MSAPLTALSVGPVPLVDHSAPRPVGLTTEVVTVSALLSMPAVWTSVVDRALPLDVLLERFMIVLLTCALLAELVRRLGEGGALSRALAEATPGAAPATGSASTTPTTATPDTAPTPTRAPDLFAADDTLALDAPPALDDPVSTDAAADLGAFDLAPLDLDADPFADPA